MDFSNENKILSDYYSACSDRNSLMSIIISQHKIHENRRWSIQDFVDEINVEDLTSVEKNFIRNAGYAELTTKPGADRLTRQSDAECRRWIDEDPALSNVMQACGTWSRYWNEEESHHEVGFNALTLKVSQLDNGKQTSLDVNVPLDEEIIEYRKIYTDDAMLRTLTVLVISEIHAATFYQAMAKNSKNETLKKMLVQISSDEVHHMNYFVAFSKALVKSGRYNNKDIFSIAYTFLKDGGELEGASRDNLEGERDFVNWWDSYECDVDGETLRDYIDEKALIEKKKSMVYRCIENITGIKVESVQEIYDLWMSSLKDNK